MSDRHKEKILPIEWFGWGEIDSTCFYFMDVVFLEDFGVFQKGEVISYIQVDYDKGIIEAYQKGILIKTQQFKCFPINIQLSGEEKIDFEKDKSWTLNTPIAPVETQDGVFIGLDEEDIQNENEFYSTLKNPIELYFAENYYRPDYLLKLIRGVRWP